MVKRLKSKTLLAGIPFTTGDFAGNEPNIL